MLSLHNLNCFMLGSNNTHLFCELTTTEVTLTWQTLREDRNLHNLDTILDQNNNPGLMWSKTISHKGK